jgi:flagellar biogenesis protein FliO
MRALASMGLVLAVALCASTAQADSITRFTVELEEADAVVRLDSDVTLGGPRMHLDAGSVRLWFTGVRQGAFLERRGDGRAVRRVSVRPGSGDTALVTLELGDARRLVPEDVRVAFDGTQAVVRIARSVLSPAMAPEVTTAPLPAVVPAPTEAPLPAVAPRVLAAPAQAAAPVPAAPPTPAATPAARSEAGPLAAPAATQPSRRPAVSARPEPPRPPESLGGFGGAMPEGKSSGLRTVGMVVALLLGLALFGRWLQQKRAKRPAAAIHVVASHRLGTKHQLVVVRAFDQEILLSVNAGETRRIASRRVGGEPESAPMTGHVDAPDGPAAAAGRLLALVPKAMPAVDRGVARETPRSAPSEPSSPFGAELARLVRGIAPPAPSTRPLVSDSVSGLVRLREAKGQR